MRKVDSLTDLKIRKLKPKESPYKVWDGKGLYLLVTPTGSKLWRLNYRFGGKYKTIALGHCPEVGLSEARERARGYRAVPEKGIDPILKKKEERLKKTFTFREVALEFLEKQKGVWVPSYYSKTLIRLEKHLLPSLGDIPIEEIDAPLILRVLEPLIRAGKSGTVKKLRGIIGQSSAMP